MVTRQGHDPARSRPSGPRATAVFNRVTPSDTSADVQASPLSENTPPPVPSYGAMCYHTTPIEVKGLVSMAVVRSHWGSVSVSGTLAGSEWAGAGNLPIPNGVVRVKNDDKYLFLLLDMSGDTGNSPGTGDYFWVSFDVNQNGAITPRLDVNYGTYPTLPIRLARQYYLGPGTWTGILAEASSSTCAQGFGPSPASAAPHRLWELRIRLSEIGVPSLATTSPPVVRFGLRVASSSPALVGDSPPNFFQNFTGLHTIALATGPDETYPPGTMGPVMAGVGLIPFTAISSGRATTAAPYVPTVTRAAFGGVLNVTFNRATIVGLWAAGARKFRVLHRDGSSGPFNPLRRSWANYRWTGSTYVLESFGPDGDDCYALPAPAADYSTKDLLFQVNTASPPLNTGSNSFQVEFRNASGAVVAAPAQTLSLYVDNRLPEVDIYAVEYAGMTVSPCSIVNVSGGATPVRVRYRAYDPEGNLLNYALRAYYGGPSTPSINLLPAGTGNYPGGDWQGVADTWVNCPLPPAFPPVSCAYQFRVSATPRVTNGYGYIGYVEATTHVTFTGAPPYGGPARTAVLGTQENDVQQLVPAVSLSGETTP